MNKDLISKHIESLHESIIDLQNRIIPLEVKNDSDKLHEKINKDEEFLNNCEGVIFRDNLTPLNINKEWINLDIDNLPERFFTRDDIEIDGQHPLTSIWISLENYSEDARKGVLNLSKLWGIKYRYRIIQEKKEPMKMNRKALWAIYKAETGKLAMQSTNKNAFRDLIFESFSKVDFTNIYVSFNGEKVEIID